MGKGNWQTIISKAYRVKVGRIDAQQEIKRLRSKCKDKGILIEDAMEFENAVIAKCKELIDEEANELRQEEDYEKSPEAPKRKKSRSSGSGPSDTSTSVPRKQRLLNVIIIAHKRVIGMLLLIRITRDYSTR
jgi:hypothetical protein